MSATHTDDRPPLVVERLSRETFLDRVHQMMTTPVDPACFQPATIAAGTFTGHSSPVPNRPLALIASEKFGTLELSREPSATFAAWNNTALSLALAPSTSAVGTASPDSLAASGEAQLALLPLGVRPFCDFADVAEVPKSLRSMVAMSLTVVTDLCHSVRDDDGDLWSVNKYNIVAPLGQGSCGTVYLVELVGSAGIDFSIGHEFGLKAIPRNARGDDGAIANEAAIMMVLNGHPHIVTLHEVIDDPEKDMLYLVMDYVPGGAIATIDADTGHNSTTLDATEMAAFVTQQASALTYVHSKGMVHGDYKVENVLFTGTRGAGLQTKLADFGVSVLAKVAAAEAAAAARRGGPTLRARPGIAGTPYIRSPEAFAGAAATAGDDAWALGVVLHTLVTGRIPFTAGTLAGMAAAVAAGLPESPAATDPPLAHEWWPCISRLLHPTSPDARVDELNRLAPATPVEPLQFSTSSKLPPKRVFSRRTHAIAGHAE